MNTLVTLILHPGPIGRMFCAGKFVLAALCTAAGQMQESPWWLRSGHTPAARSWPHQFMPSNMLLPAGPDFASSQLECPWTWIPVGASELSQE